MGEIISKEESYARTLNGTTITTTVSGGVSSADSKLTYVEKDTFVGEKNPHWKAQVARGQDASTPYEGVRRGFHTKPYLAEDSVQYTNYQYPYYTASRLSHGRDYHGDATVTEFPVPLWAQVKAENRAKQEFVSKIRDKQTAFQGGTFLGELGATIRAIKSPAQGLRRGYNRYFRSLNEKAPLVRSVPTRSGRIREATRIASDTWLEYNLGWAPLINETRSAIKALKEDQMFEETYSERVVGFGEVDFHYSTTPSSTQRRPGFQYDSIKYGTVLVKYYGGVGMGLSAAGYAAKQVGLHPTNWLPTVWELIPYSFVIDYFSNVGGIIDAASLGNSSLTWSCRVSRQATYSKSSNWKLLSSLPDPWNHASGPIVYRTGVPGGFFGYTVKVQRTTDIGSLVPTLDFNLPWSGTQWITLSALLGASAVTRKLFRI